VIEQQALIHILMDHANMVAALKKIGQIDIRNSD